MQTKPQTFYLSWLVSLPLMGLAFLPVYAQAHEASDHDSHAISDMPQRFERNGLSESIADRAHFTGNDRTGFSHGRSSDRDFRNGNTDIAGRYDHPRIDRIYRSDAPQRIMHNDREQDGADQVNIDGDNMTGFSDDQASDWGLGYDSEGMATNDDGSDFDGNNLTGFSDDQPSDWDSNFNTEVLAPDDDSDMYPSYNFYLPNDD